MNNTAPDIRAERSDIQAIVLSGLSSLTHSRYWLLEVTGPEAARQWLRDILQRRLVRHVGEVGGKTARSRFDEAVSIAFSHAGLVELGVRETAEFPFPSPFKSGMGSATRAALLRDTDRSGWTWGDTGMAGRRTAHLLVAHFWQAGEPASLFGPDLASHGFGGEAVTGLPDFFRDGGAYEPFGFRDGLSQPLLRGLREQASPATGPGDHGVEPGEVLLGHPNEYQELTYCPDAVGWADSAANAGRKAVRFGMNGSYLAVRQIAQDVDAFDRLHAIPAPTPGCPFAMSLAEKVMGRRHGDPGSPLAWLPDVPADANDFRYRVSDPLGFQCPRGSHVRRANPRDGLGHDVESGVAASKLHRLLRRGRSYLADGGHKAGSGPGMFFIACNADLDRQFEFVMQRWIANPRFSGSTDQTDPLLGAGANRRFSTTGLPIGSASMLQALTTTLGGGYFFLPGLRALQFIAQ